MRAFICMAVLFVLALTCNVQAFEVQARASQMIYNHHDLKANPGDELETLELRLIHKNLGFAYGSVDPLRMWGQDLEMWSVGLGYQQPVCW